MKNKKSEKMYKCGDCCNNYTAKEMFVPRKKNSLRQKDYLCLYCLRNGVLWDAVEDIIFRVKDYRLLADSSK